MLPLVLLILAQAPSAENSRVTRVERVPGGRAVGGRSGGSRPSFVGGFSASGTGTSGQCSTTAPSISVGGAPATVTSTRSTVAECYSNDGQTLTQLAINKARVSSGSAASSTLRLWSEGASQNDITFARDFSDASWVKVNMTCTKTITGMRSDANSASRCTATAPNGTVCTTLVLAAAQRASSGHIKRAVGTGAVTLSRDAVTYSSSIASSLSSTVWRRAVPWDTAGCAGGNCIVVPGLTSSVLNPSICIKLATSGDAVDLDFWQDEASANCAGYCSTSPIATAGTAVARGADSHIVTATMPALHSLSAKVTVAPNLRNLTGVLMAQVNGSNAVYLMKDAFSTTLDQNFGCHQYVGGVDNYSNGNLIAMPSATSFLPVGCDIVDSATITSWGRGWTAPYVAGPPLVTVAPTSIILGNINAAGFEINGVIGDICGDPVAGFCTSRISYDSEGSPVGWMGDSIPLGDQAAPNRPPFALQRLLLGTRTVYNLGIGGHTAAQCLADYRDHVAGKGYSTVVVHCGVNSINQSVSAVAAMADLTTLYDLIRASGAKLIIGNLLAWSGFATWDAAKQTQTLALNSLIATYGSTYSVSVIDVYTALGSGTALNPIYNSGDGLHLNSAGASAYAALVQAATP